jgi:hypothetical protein
MQINCEEIQSYQDSLPELANVMFPQCRNVVQISTRENFCFFFGSFRMVIFGGHQLGNIFG